MTSIGLHRMEKPWILEALQILWKTWALLSRNHENQGLRWQGQGQRQKKTSLLPVSQDHNSSSQYPQKYPYLSGYSPPQYGVAAWLELFNSLMTPLHVSVSRSYCRFGSKQPCPLGISTVCSIGNTARQGFVHSGQPSFPTHTTGNEALCKHLACNLQGK